MRTPWGTTVLFEVSRALPTADPDWFDLSDRLLAAGYPLDIAEGRQTELAGVEPANFVAQLQNRDDALTPGNPTSPYPWWKQSLRCRLREIVAGQAIELFDGYLEVTENTVRKQNPADGESDVVLTVTGVDLLGRLQNSRKFITTTAAHVLAPVTPSPWAYYLLNEAAGSKEVADQSGNRRAGLSPPTTGLVFAYAAADGPPADEIQVASWRERSTAPDGIAYDLRAPLQLTLDTTTAVTVVAWVNTISDADPSGVIEWVDTSTNSSLYLTYRPAERTFWAGMVGDTWDYQNQSYPAMVGSGQVRMVRARLQLSQQPVVEVDDRGEVAAGTPFGVQPTSLNLDQLRIGGGLGDLGISHVQIYVSTSSDFTAEDQAEQHLVGRFGLERQSTGQRVNTILDYAGVPSHQRDIDPGVSVMRKAQLAGKSPADALGEAVVTEQGRLFTYAGRMVFHDRSRIYNV